MKLNAKTNVVIGGKSRELVLNMNTLSMIEEVLDINLMQDGEAFFASLTFSKMRVLIWAMLHKEKPSPDLVQVGEWLSDSDMDVIGGSLGKLFSMDSKKSDSKTASKKASDPMRG